MYGLRMQQSPGARVEVDGISKRYLVGDNPLVALDQVSLDVELGEMLALMGPSGSGKSTLLHLIGAMDSADEGRIVVGEHEVTALDRGAQVDYRRRIGFVFQRFHLLPALTVLDNVAAPLLPYRTGFDKFAKAKELVAAVGLAGREESLPSRLSGGEQQRVAIARALVNDPILLLADEPTGNLDSHTGAEIVELLLQLREQHGMTVIVATHNPLVAARCDRIARLHDGQIVDILSVLPELELEEVLERITRFEEPVRPSDVTS
jgi:putative ABC transport system ATP-binding protein